MGNGILKSLPTFFSLLLISLLLIFLEKQGMVKPLREGVEIVTKPVKRGIYRPFQRIRGQWLFLSSRRSQSEKIKFLEEKEQELLAEKEKNRALLEENKALRAQLEAPLPPTWEFLPAQTLGQTPLLTLDKGEKNGVKVGQTAIFKNILVGKVVKITPYQSQVQLPTDPSAKIPVVCQKTRARGILRGEFGKSLVLGEVLQGETLEVGDLLVTTGEGDFPKGLLVGKITEVEKLETEVFQKAQISPLLDYEKLETVFLLVP